MSDTPGGSRGPDIDPRVAAMAEEDPDALHVFATIGRANTGGACDELSDEEIASTMLHLQDDGGVLTWYSDGERLGCVLHPTKEHAKAYRSEEPRPSRRERRRRHRRGKPW